MNWKYRSHLLENITVYLFTFSKRCRAVLYFYGEYRKHREKIRHKKLLEHIKGKQQNMPNMKGSLKRPFPLSRKNKYTINWERETKTS